VIAAIIVAFIIELAKGHSVNRHGWLDAIGCLTYLVAIVVFRIRGSAGRASSGRRCRSTVIERSAFRLPVPAKTRLPDWDTHAPAAQQPRGTDSASV
jgi:hypothetical protein